MKTAWTWGLHLLWIHTVHISSIKITWNTDINEAQVKQAISKTCSDQGGYRRHTTITVLGMGELQLKVKLTQNWKQLEHDLKNQLSLCNVKSTTENLSKLWTDFDSKIDLGNEGEEF